MKIKNMTNKETAAHLRGWVKESHGPFSWPTDTCGRDQHIRFVSHRNANWREGYPGTFEQFVLDYADMLEAE